MHGSKLRMPQLPRSTQAGVLGHRAGQVVLRELLPQHGEALAFASTGQHYDAELRLHFPSAVTSLCPSIYGMLMSVINISIRPAANPLRIWLATIVPRT